MEKTDANLIKICEQDTIFLTSYIFLNGKTFQM